MPEQPSHSLKLVRALGIPMADRTQSKRRRHGHSEVIQNAFGQRFRKEIIKDFIKFKIEKGLALKLTDILNVLPAVTGVYYIYNESGTLIYIGKSINIRKKEPAFYGITNSAKNSS
jgi:DNA polymerase-3 subunit epsilon